MKNAIIAAALTAGLALPAAAQTTTSTTTTTWSPTIGQELTQSYTTQKYTVVQDPSLSPAVGAELPASVTFYPLPANVTVPNADQYSYTVINNHPVVVEKTTRRVVKTW